MTRELRYLVVQVITLIGVTIVMLGFLFVLTVAPMMRNYSECGTIFLCATQPPIKSEG